MCGSHKRACFLDRCRSVDGTDGRKGKDAEELGTGTARNENIVYANAKIRKGWRVAVYLYVSTH